MMKNIRPFLSFQKVKRGKINEAVSEVGNILKISNIDIKKTDVKSYMNRVKQEKDIDLSLSMSISDVAEEMVKYSLENGYSFDELPAEALLGGEPDMMESPVETEEVDMKEEVDGVETETEAEEETEMETEMEIEDDFENLTDDDESGEVGDENTEDESVDILDEISDASDDVKDEDEDEEETDLPI